MKKLLSRHILKQSVKNSWKLWAILTGVLCFFLVSVTLVATSGGSGPGGMRSGSGMDLLNMYSLMFFGMMGLMFMLIYAIAVGNKLVASEIDKGTMSFTLNTPITRTQVIISKLFFYVTSIIAMAVLVGLAATVTSAAVGADITYGKLWMLVLGFILLSLATSGICFASSCWFNKSGQALLLGAGLPVAFYLLSSFSNLITINGTEFLKYFSLNTLFDTGAIIAGTGFIIQFIAMTVIGVALYTIGVMKFLKKDLPL